MGIKTRFNPMGGDANGGGEPRPSIPDYWSYTTRTNETGKDVRTLYFYNNTLAGNEQVTVPYGYTELQDYVSSTNNSYSTLPFYNHQNLTSVDLKNVPFRNGSMWHAFDNCSGLTHISNMNQKVTKIAQGFQRCYNFNQNVKIPDSVKEMQACFYNCYNFNQNVKIPVGVTNILYSFYGCFNLNQNIQIPTGIINMYQTFKHCENLNQNIQIPSTVINVNQTFANCGSLNFNIKLPANATDCVDVFHNCISLNQNIQIPIKCSTLMWAFKQCFNLKQNIQIPSNVTNIYECFNWCNNLGSDKHHINILSANISNALNAFSNTSTLNISNQLTIVFPLRYINNVNTVTRNSLVAAGYAVGTGLGVTSANATQNRNLLCWDIIPYQGYSTYTGNGTHWVLTKWDGRKGALPKNITVPARITSYATFPTAITKATFTANKLVTGIDCNHVPFNGTAVDNAFRNCTSATYINNINIPYGVTTVKDLVSFDVNLLKLSTGKGTDGTANLDLPDSVTDTQAVFARTKRISNYYLNSKSSTTLAYAMDYVNVTPWNLYVKSPNVTSTKNFCRGSNTAIRKNIYIYYKYANGVATKTFNAFKAAVYTSTTGNSGATSPMYNAKSNFYIYNLGTCPI